MKGVRLDRFLASTAIALFLCAGGAAWAGSSGDQDTPAATETTSPDADQAAASSEVVADPATDAAPASAAEFDVGHSLIVNRCRTRRSARDSGRAAG